MYLKFDWMVKMGFGLILGDYGADIETYWIYCMIGLGSGL